MKKILILMLLLVSSCVTSKQYLDESYKKTEIIYFSEIQDFSSKLEIFVKIEKFLKESNAESLSSDYFNNQMTAIIFFPNFIDGEIKVIKSSLKIDFYSDLDLVVSISDPRFEDSRISSEDKNSIYSIEINWNRFLLDLKKSIKN